MHYFFIFIICGTIGGILGAMFGNVLLGAIFEIHEKVNISYTILSVLFILLIGFLTVGGKMIGVLKRNPAEVLKSE